MIKMKVSTSIDYSGLKKLQKQLQKATVEVGYINSPDHWNDKRIGQPIPVAQLASHLHYWSPWRDTFMLSESKKGQVQSIVSDEMRKLGNISVYTFANNVGKRAANQIEMNIHSTKSPPNSESWANHKGFNDPLEYGSRKDETPNLISEIRYTVGENN